MPYTPHACSVFRSAWMPAPPPGSEPATASTLGTADTCRDCRVCQYCSEKGSWDWSLCQLTHAPAHCYMLPALLPLNKQAAAA